MEQDKYISLSDSYVEIEGVENDVSQFVDDILNKKKWIFPQSHKLKLL